MLAWILLVILLRCALVFLEEILLQVLFLYKTTRWPDEHLRAVIYDTECLLFQMVVKWPRVRGFLTHVGLRNDHGAGNAS